ncbi:pyridoxamine 5'-phosphate oxidase family protein [Streptomyces sp. CA-132043]|uniref:pyridoxamine 5'-phosphate oxidase family protein n=1 Tax=Streptomyces sp. CA-132043 TaxID=3240048 RepID=UPI003D8F612E
MLTTVRRGDTGLGPLPKLPFDLAEFLAAPRVAHLATQGTDGPVVRPVWFLWEDEIFWVITGSWARLEQQLTADPRFSLVVDSCDLATGRVRQVTAYGHGTVTAFDADRGRRKLRRYLGDQEKDWDIRFRPDAGATASPNRWARLVPDVLRIGDLSFRPASESVLRGAR